MIIKPDNSFTVIISCNSCMDTGIVIAVKRDEPLSGDYAFRCECHRGNAKNLPSVPMSNAWVAEFVDKRPTDIWFNEKFKLGSKLATDVEFQRRKEIWGHDWFASQYILWKSKQGDHT